MNLVEAVVGTREVGLLGKYVLLEWTDEAGVQSAEGVLVRCEVNVEGCWAVLDWGYTVKMSADDFRMSPT